MAPEINAGYLNYLRGSAEDRLNEAFDSPEAPASEKFRHELERAINVYGGNPEQIGRQAAELVEQLPYEGSFGIEDGYIGLEILRHTEELLRQLIENDEEFRKNIRESATDDETDKAIREQADEFDTDFNIDGKSLGKYRDSAKGFKWGIDDDGVRNSFYGANAGDIEGKIKAEAKEEKPEKKIAVTLLEGEAKTTPIEPPAAAAPATAPEPAPTLLPEPPAAAKPNSNPNPNPSPSPNPNPPTPPAAPRLEAVRIEIQAPDFSEREPRSAFRAGMDWLAEHIIAVAAGTRKKNSYPRLEPLLALQEKFPTLTTTMARITEGVARIKRHFQKLRPPSGGEMDDAMHELLDPDSGLDPKKRVEKMFDVFKNLREKKNEGEGEWDKPWGEGGWQDE